jgi:hypothetical protein
MSLLDSCRRVFRSGRPVPQAPITWRTDEHRLGGSPDFLGITPPYTRDWSQYQTFWNGNQYPGFGWNQGQYTYPYAAIRKDVPGTASFNHLRGGSVSEQVGSVTVARLLDKMRAAWASSQR